VVSFIPFFAKKFTQLHGKMLFLARPNRITLGRKRKALLIGINYDDAQELDIVRLKFPQRDLRDMRALLKGQLDIIQRFGGL
jgi:hypothetical protein